MKRSGDPRQGPPDSADTATPRIHYVDWLRLIAIFSVFVFHATRPFQTVGSEWHVVSDRQSVPLTVFAAFLAQWLPSLLFLVSGAAASFAVERRNNASFLRERTTRLLVPYVVGAIVLTPIQLLIGQQHRGAAVQPSLGSLSELWADIVSQPDVVGPRFLVETGLHLWFLGFLYVCSVASLPVLRWLRDGGSRLIDVLARAAYHRLGLIGFVIPLALSRFVLPVRGPGRYDWADFCFLLLYFLAGAVLYADPRFLTALRRDRWMLLGIGVIADLVLAVLLGTGVLPDAFTQPGTPSFYAGWSFLSAATWCWSLVVLEAGRSKLDFANEQLTSWTGTAIAFYLIHQPVLIAIAFFVVRWDQPVQLQFWALLGMALIATLAIVAIVRRTAVLRLALGVKR